MINDCIIIRIKLVTHSKLNIITGVITPERSETVTEPCGIPLFRSIERRTGVCNSCANGWTHEHNNFANDAERLKAITSREGK